jgi:uncharacterized protein YdeI (BOF family)
MKNLNLKCFVYFFLVVSGILWVLIAIWVQVDLSKIFDFFSILPKVATIDLILAALFAKWGWKSKIFQGWLVPFPNLNGTWQGNIQTTWVNPVTGQRPGPIPTILTVKQSFGRISCVMRTAEMTSYSYAAEFELQQENQIRQLIYTYTSKTNPTVTDRSAIHDGTIVFEIVGNPVSRLKGNYWTARRTTGEVTLTFRCKDRLDELPQDIGPHPVSQ